MAAVKECPLCTEGFTVQHLMKDLAVEPIGMLIEGADFATASYFFNHTCPGCGTTFAVPVAEFAAHITGPIPRALLADSDVCDGHCTRLADLAGCDQPCAGAPYRRFLVDTLVRQRP